MKKRCLLNGLFLTLVASSISFADQTPPNQGGQPGAMGQTQPVKMQAQPNNIAGFQPGGGVGAGQPQPGGMQQQRGMPAAQSTLQPGAPSPAGVTQPAASRPDTVPQPGSMQPQGAATTPQVNQPLQQNNGMAPQAGGQQGQPRPENPMPGQNPPPPPPPPPPPR